MVWEGTTRTTMDRAEAADHNRTEKNAPRRVMAGSVFYSLVIVVVVVTAVIASFVAAFMLPAGGMALNAILEI